MANKEDSSVTSNGREEKYKAYEIAEILQAKHAFMSGGEDNNGNILITIPTTSRLNNGIKDKDLRKLFTYFTNLQSFFDKDPESQEFAIILDRRKSKWSSVNNSLTTLKKTFPSRISCVFVLKPQGFLQKITGGGLANEEAQAAFKIVVLSNVVDLERYIPLDHLSQDLGGKLQYNNEQWIEHRSAIERFEVKVLQLEQKLENLRRTFENTEITSNIEEMEFTLDSHREMWKDLKEDIVSTRTSGITILKCIHPNRHKDTEKETSSTASPDVKANTEELDGLFKRLHDADSSFSDFWDTHDLRIRQGMQLLQFEKEVGQVTGLLLSDSSKLSSMADVGDCKSAAEKILEDLKEFTLICQDHITLAEALIKRGAEMTDANHLSKITIQMTSKELQRSCDDLKEKISKREKQLKTAMDIHECLDQAGKWCTKGSDLLATQPVEKFQTVEGAEKCLQEIENFLKDRQGISLKKLNQMDRMSKETDNKYMIQKVKNCLKRIGEVNEMMSKRENSLKRMVAKRPVQPVKALQVDTREDGKRKASTGSIGRRDSKRKISSASYTGDERKVKSSPTPKRPLSIVVTRDTSPPSPVPLSKNYAKAVSIPDLLDAIDGEDTPDIIKKRMMIMMELVATERDYVQDLNCIILGYVREFEKAQDKIPEELFTQKHLIFGNIEEIYRFHNEDFLKELERCVDSPLLVGQVFHDKRDQFELYATYCKNKPASEHLQQNFINLPFVKELQVKLGHKLPLTAYLLKPVQRITKYQLLLKEMMKNTRNNRAAYINLMEALQSMQGVLRHLNDVMHSRGLRGYNGNHAELGKLLLQESFMVWHLNKRGILPQKGRKRQVFLYEKMLLFTKREEDLNSKDASYYQFKHSLKLSEIGITENVKQDPLKFELWLNKKSEIFILQASSLEEKDRWISKVRNVLMSQFDQAKAEQAFKKQEWKSAPTMGTDEIQSSCSNLSFLSLSQERGLDDSSQNDNFEDDFDSFDSDDSDTQSTTSHVEPLSMEHGYLYSVIASYNAVEKGEMSIREKDTVEVLRLGSDGWWYARHVVTKQEGWIPASYLEPLPNNNSTISP